MEPRWILYCHTHTESGRRYIGLTKLTMLKRWNQHLNNASKKRGKGCHHFWNAIRKYGPQAFSHEVLEVCTSLEVANLAEECWIEFFDTRNREKGFNLTRGGKHTPHSSRNPWDRPEYREKACAASKRRWENPEFRAKMSARDYDTSGLHRPESIEKLRSIQSSPEFRAEASRRMSKVMSDPVVKAKISKSARGRVLTDEQRASISSRMKGHRKSEEVKGKVSASLRGRSLSEETRLKISEARKRQVLDPSVYEKISQKLRGRKHTDEAKARMSEVQKRKAAERVSKKEAA